MYNKLKAKWKQVENKMEIYQLSLVLNEKLCTTESGGGQ